MTSFLLIERDGPIVTAILNRPQSRNAISRVEDIRELEAFCADVGSDSSVRAVVLTGEGTAFCSGGDVKAMREKSGTFAGSPFELRNRYRHGIQVIPRAFFELEVPIVAAVNGPAIGAGLDLACMCDVRIAAAGATFAESFVKLGIVPGDGGAWLLPRIVGMARASLLSLTGDSIDAETALAWGLVSEVVPAEALRERARAIAERIAANPSAAVRLTKRLLREGADMKLQPLLELSAAYQALAHHTLDHDEAVAAFLDRRSPSFKDL